MFIGMSLECSWKDHRYFKFADMIVPGTDLILSTDLQLLIIVVVVAIVVKKATTSYQRKLVP